MTPIVKEPSKQLDAYLAKFDHAGGVVDYVLFEDIDPSKSTKEFHRLAAIAALQQIDRRLEDYAKTMAPKTGSPVEDFFRLSFDIDKISGRKVSKDEFLGPHYLIANGKLIMRGITDDGMNDYFQVGDEEKPENIIEVTHDGDLYVSGYAQAFSEPPYPIDMTSAEIEELFFLIGKMVYGEISSEMEIYEWAGPWSNYFDAGLDYWGAFLWTVCNKANGKFAAIGVSATD
jgi:hypothetical protein